MQTFDAIPSVPPETVDGDKPPSDVDAQQHEQPAAANVTAAADAHEGTAESKTTDVRAKQKTPEDVEHAQDMQRTEPPTIEINSRDDADDKDVALQTHTPTEVQGPTSPTNMELDDMAVAKGKPADMKGIDPVGSCDDHEMKKDTSEQPSSSQHQKIKKHDKKHKEKSEKHDKKDKKEKKDKDKDNKEKKHKDITDEEGQVESTCIQQSQPVTAEDCLVAMRNEINAAGLAAPPSPTDDLEQALEKAGLKALHWLFILNWFGHLRWVLKMDQYIQK